MTENETRICGTCEYSRTKEVYDPIVDSVKSMFNSMPGIDVEKLIRYDITKCHFQGPPQMVSANDWCYRWEPK
jgi:hypothetical protein